MIEGTSVTEEQINELMDTAESQDFLVNGNTTVLVMRFRNGWTEVASSSCVYPENYDHELGVAICRKDIEDRIWKLEGYMMANKRIGMAEPKAEDHGIPIAWAVKKGVKMNQAGFMETVYWPEECQPYAPVFGSYEEAEEWIANEASEEL